MGVSILVLIYRIIVVFIGVSLLAYRQMVRYNSENITLQVVEAKKYGHLRHHGDLPIFVTYEYNGVVYQQKSIEFGVFLFSFKNKTIYNCTGKRSKSGKVSCDQIFCIEKIALFFILAGVCSFLIAGFDAVLLVI